MDNDENGYLDGGLQQIQIIEEMADILIMIHRMISSLGINSCPIDKVYGCQTCKANQYGGMCDGSIGDRKK